MNLKQIYDSKASQRRAILEFLIEARDNFNPYEGLSVSKELEGSTYDEYELIVRPTGAATVKLLKNGNPIYILEDKLEHLDLEAVVKDIISFL